MSEMEERDKAIRWRRDALRLTKFNSRTKKTEAKISLEDWTSGKMPNFSTPKFGVNTGLISVTFSAMKISLLPAGVGARWEPSRSKTSNKR